MKRRILFSLLSVLSLTLALTVLLTDLPGAVSAQRPKPSSGARAQTALGTAFTYQGRLTDGGDPANGTYDFRFIVYNAAIGGSQVGNIVPKDDVTVTDGFFTVQIDCGSGVFTGEARYLEIGVRPGDSTGNFIVLTPRQPLMPAPYAFYAPAASSLHAADGDPQEALFVDNEGNVGIGTTSPAAKLDIAGNVKLNGNIQYGNLSDYRMVYRDDFESNAIGWSMSTTSTIAGARILGGCNVSAGTSFYKDFDLTGNPHSEVMVRLTYYAIDSWDQEWAYVSISSGTSIVPGIWSMNNISWTVPGRINVGCLSAPDGSYFAEVRASHTGNTLRVTAGSTLDQPPSDESFGIDNVEVWVR